MKISIFLSPVSYCPARHRPPRPRSTLLLGDNNEIMVGPCHGERKILTCPEPDHRNVQSQGQEGDTKRRLPTPYLLICSLARESEFSALSLWTRSSSSSFLNSLTSCLVLHSCCWASEKLEGKRQTRGITRCRTDL